MFYHLEKRSVWHRPPVSQIYSKPPAAPKKTKNYSPQQFIIVCHLLVMRSQQGLTKTMLRVELYEISFFLLFFFSVKVVVARTGSIFQNDDTALVFVCLFFAFSKYLMFNRVGNIHLYKIY